MNQNSKSEADKPQLNLHNLVSRSDPPSTTEPATMMTASVKKAVAEEVKQSGQPLVPHGGEKIGAEGMLSAVSYCYAKGVYESKEIEKTMLNDPRLRAKLG